jgi:hypothetical protein
LGQNLCP